MKAHLISNARALLCGAGLLGLGCSGGEVDLGGGLVTQSLSQASRCAESTTLSGDIHVATQAELDALDGCEAIDGSLRIEVIEDLALAPLASLRRVSGAFELGAAPIEVLGPEEALAAGERAQALIEAGWLESLAELGDLESAEVIYLTGVGVPDFSELTSLQQLEALVIVQPPNLQSLAGLEAVELSFLWISSAYALQSIDGLALTAGEGSILLDAAPALKNIDPLAGATSLETLYLLSTGLEALPQFSQLQYVQDIAVDGNLQLTDASGLSSLTAVGTLAIRGNPQLPALPDLSGLTSLQTLRVANNAALEEVDLSFPELTPALDYSGDREVQFSADMVEINENASLRRITSTAGFSALQFFGVSQNPSLTSLELGSLERADLLLISGNPLLESVSAPSLLTVDTLEVVDNPSLDPSVFDAVPSFRRELSGNAAP